MADDEPSDPKFFETVPRVRGGFSAIGSAGAPFIYFDNVPFFGLMNGVAQITLDLTDFRGRFPKAGLLSIGSSLPICAPLCLP